MKKCLILFSVVFGLLILQSQASNLSACKGNYWTNCFGTYTYPNGDKYVGEFKDDKRNGMGIYIWGPISEFSGDKYAGQYKDNKFHGFGTYSFANGNRDVGQWENNKLNGNAIEYNADGSIYRQGVYKDDKLQYTNKIQPDLQTIIPDNAYALGDIWKCKSGF